MRDLAVGIAAHVRPGRLDATERKPSALSQGEKDREQWERERRLAKIEERIQRELRRRKGEAEYYAGEQPALFQETV